MNIPEFLNTIYLGDRGLMAIIIDCWSDRLKFQINCISRVRDKTWDFYNLENIDNSFIVFEGISHILIEPANVTIAADFINELSVENYSDSEEIYSMFMSCGGAVDGEFVEVKIRFHAKTMYLEDIKNPDIKILE